MIENDDTLDTQPVNFQNLPFVMYVIEDRINTKIFSNNPALFKKLLFTCTTKDILRHSKSSLQTQRSMSAYYTDRRTFFNRWYIYHFHDVAVDGIWMNNKQTQVAVWHNGPTIEL